MHEGWRATQSYTDYKKPLQGSPWTCQSNGMFGFWFYCPVEHILFYPKATYPKSKEWNMTLQTSGKQIGRKRGLLLTFPVPLGWSYGRVRYFHRTRSFGGWLGVKASWGKTWKSWAGIFIMRRLEVIKDSWDSRVASFKMKHFVWTVGFKPCT